ncbi:transposase [Rhizobium lusitanum]|uniref:Transposase n=1 Tax=Rhizobium lusitanum TaxID=293958 RepID=A0A6L9UL01_9HYPH|nr:transposase [Rhizobium lusitanum]NEI75012.1 transposase [Rhizobium lusitanum]
MYGAPSRPYQGLPEVDCPFHDRPAIVKHYGRLGIHRKKIDIPTVLAGQKLGLKEIDDTIWLVSFMSYDLGYTDLEQRTLQAIDLCLRDNLSPMSPGRT